MKKHILTITAGTALVSLVVAVTIARADRAGAQPLVLGWTQSAPFPEPTSGYAAGVLHHELVISGGTYWLGTKHNWTKKIFSATTYSFDPVTRQWRKLPDAPIPLGYAAGTVVGETLFVLGGFTGDKVSRDIYSLQRNGDQYIWKKFGELPVDRVFASAVTIGTKIYLVGGSTQFEPTDALGTCCTSKTATSSLMVLDTAHPERGWRELASFPAPRRLFFTAETDGKAIWLFGGQFQANTKEPVVNIDEVLRYDPKSGEWRLMTHLPQPLKNNSFVSPVYYRKRMILISSLKKTWELELRSLKYQELTPLPKDASVDKFVSLGEQIVGSGGESIEEPARRRSEWTFIGQVPDN